MPPSDKSPPIGALLRTQWEVVRSRQLEHLHAQGFDDITPQHIPVLQWPGPHEQRPSEIAALLRISKQARNNLLRDLERLDYVERRDDPNDGRSTLICATPRGERAMRVMHGAARSVEQEWAKQLGKKQAAELRASLTRLADAR
jgi:DNA-binding MarR family transcriptional regulator